MRKTKSRNSLGPDSISTKLLKDIGPQICIIVGILLNMSISKSIDPENIKLAKIISVFKARHGSELSSYRTISMLQGVYNFVKCGLHKRLYSFLAVTRILYQSQHSLLPKYSTTDAVT